MKNTFRSIGRRRSRGSAGFSLIEVLVSVAIMTLIMASTMSALSQAMKANETAPLVTGMNNSLRTGMDLIIRDLLQVGSGLPVGHAVQIPCCTTQINLPGPPGPISKYALGEPDLDAVKVGTRLGPLVNQIAGTACTVESATCVKTDIITTMAADSTFTDVRLTSRLANGTRITVDPAVNILGGADRILPGQLIMLEKGSYTVLLQVTQVDSSPSAHTITFDAADSLNLNVHNAASGSVNGVAGLNAWAPAGDTAPEPGQTFLHTTATRIRMISYYIDATDPAHPKLVRRINNGDPLEFDNNSGSVVAFDVDNLKISYDIADGDTNPAGITFSAADFAAGGKCFTATCSPAQIRKVNVLLSARSRLPFSTTRKYFHNTLTTQVSLRGMSFVNEYAPPQ